LQELDNKIQDFADMDLRAALAALGCGSSARCSALFCAALGCSVLLGSGCAALLLAALGCSGLLQPALGCSGLL